MNIFKRLFGNPTRDCLDDIVQLSNDNNLTDDNLNFIRNKYPNELHSWVRGKKVVKIRMYKI